MDNQKPIVRLLFWAAAIQAIYLAVLAAIEVFYEPILQHLWRFTREEARAVNRPVPYMVLGEGILILLGVLCFSCWIYTSIKRSRDILLPCAMSFMLVGVSPVLSGFGKSLQQIINDKIFEKMEFPGMSVTAYELLDSMYTLVEPIHLAGMTLLAIGAALALYWQKYVKSSDGDPIKT